MLKRYRKRFIFLLIPLALAAGWIYWNRIPKSDMAGYVPAESLAYIEANDLVSVAHGISGTEAWRLLAQPLGAPAQLVPRRWPIQVARWTGIGSAEAVLLARSQFGLVFTQAQAIETGSTLTIKPLAALVIETHTSQRRMRPVIEKHLEDFARRAYGEPSLTRKQIDGVDLVEWKSPDNTRRLTLAIVDTVAIVGNDESIVLNCIDVRRGKRPSLAANQQLQTMRQQLGAARASLFGFVPKAGVKAVIQAWAFSRAANATDAASVAPIISNAFGNLIDVFAWTSRFDDGGAEDRWRVAQAPGVSQQLATLMTPEPAGANLDFSFVPPDASSVTSYQLRNPASFWRELNIVVSSRSDALTAIASRPLLRGLLEPYGINDPDRFFSAIRPRLQVVRWDNSVPAILIGKVIDKPALSKIAEQRIGRDPKVEKLGQGEMFVGSDGWCVAFEGDHFLTGPADGIRRCLEAKAGGHSIEANAAFRRARNSIDMSLPIVVLTFANDAQSAISFIELFSSRDRSAFSTDAAAVHQGADSLPYSVSVTAMKGDVVDWSSRSSFGLLGSLFTTFAPEGFR